MKARILQKLPSFHEYMKLNYFKAIIMFKRDISAEKFKRKHNCRTI